MMLHHVGQRVAAERIEHAVLRTLEKGEGLTRDLGGDGNTATITEQIIKNLG
jgi:isocitrate dehydrogenase (NAD+)